MNKVCLTIIALVLCMSAAGQTNSYKVTTIVNNTQDSFLINPWGLSRPTTSTLKENQWWVSDNGTGFSTLYFADKTGRASLAPLVITIPSASGVGKGTPTGTAYNAAVGPGPGANNFTFVTLDGTISNWNADSKPVKPGNSCYRCHVGAATIMVNHSPRASYTGLTIAQNMTSRALTYYAADNNGGVETYDATSFSPVTLPGGFVDPKIPSAYKPYGIQAIGSKIYVSFYNGISAGFVDAFDTNGVLQQRLQQGRFSQPWGIVKTPAGFGVFSNMLLVGNTTSGWIAAFDPRTGAFQRFLQDSAGKVITIPGLWGLGFGNGNAESGPTTTLYFTAGGNYTAGAFGAITAN